MASPLCRHDPIVWEADEALHWKRIETRLRWAELDGSPERVLSADDYAIYETLQDKARLVDLCEHGWAVTRVRNPLPETDVVAMAAPTEFVLLTKGRHHIAAGLCDGEWHIMQECKSLLLAYVRMLEGTP